MQKPIATEITSWHPYKEILYKCPMCGADFRFFGNKEKFCNNCGEQIDWDVLLQLDESFDKNNYEAEKNFIFELNMKQRK